MDPELFIPDPDTAINFYKVKDPNPSNQYYLSIFGNFLLKKNNFNQKEKSSTNYRYRYISAIFYFILQSYRPSLPSSNVDLKALFYFFLNNFAFNITGTFLTRCPDLIIR